MERLSRSRQDLGKASKELAMDLGKATVASNTEHTLKTMTSHKANSPERHLSHAEIATAKMAALLVAQSRYVEMPHAMSLYAPKSKNVKANMLSRNPSMKSDQKSQNATACMTQLMSILMPRYLK